MFTEHKVGSINTCSNPPDRMQASGKALRLRKEKALSRMLPRNHVIGYPITSVIQSLYRKSVESLESVDLFFYPIDVLKVPIVFRRIWCIWSLLAAL